MRDLAPFLIALLLLPGRAAEARQASQPEPVREYALMLGELTETGLAPVVGLTLNRAGMDLWFRGIGRGVPPKLQPWLDTAWSILWTFTCTMWPHDYGHWTRARQVGGDFLIHRYTFPFPEAEMIQPAEYGPGEDALAITAGFEVNHLMARRVHLDLLQRGWAFGDDLVHAFIQLTHYPSYAFLLTPADPEDPETWTDTRGDPVESTLIVWEKHTGRSAVRTDQTVDPDLVRYYRESIYLSLLWTLLDPMLYRDFRGFSANMREDHGLERFELWGDGPVGWRYGTRFHSSPLGYELYLDQYLRYRERLYALYLKWGRPYRNLGLGVEVPTLYERGRLAAGVRLDLWDQDIFGRGGAGSLDLEYRPTDSFSLLVSATGKSRGYLIGRRLEAGLTLLGGCRYRF